MGRARYDDSGEPRELDPDVDFQPDRPAPGSRLLPRYAYEEDAARAEIARKLEEDSEDEGDE